MEPITRSELFLAAAVGEYDGALPEPITREEKYLDTVCKRLDNIEKPTDAQVRSAVGDYLDDYLTDHDIAFIVSNEISEVLHG